MAEGRDPIGTPRSARQRSPVVQGCHSLLRSGGAESSPPGSSHRRTKIPAPPTPAKTTAPPRQRDQERHGRCLEHRRRVRRGQQLDLLGCGGGVSSRSPLPPRARLLGHSVGVDVAIHVGDLGLRQLRPRVQREVAAAGGAVARREAVDERVVGTVPAARAEAAAAGERLADPRDDRQPRGQQPEPPHRAGEDEDREASRERRHPHFLRSSSADTRSKVSLSCLRIVSIARSWPKR